MVDSSGAESDAISQYILYRQPKYPDRHLLFHGNIK